MISILLAIIVFNTMQFSVFAYLYFKPARLLKFHIETISPVTIIIACYNEGPFIERKLHEILNDDEWIEGSELIVVSNGSTDNTNSVLEKFNKDKRLKIFIFEKRIGKINSINFASALAQNNILIFSDSRQKIKKHSIKNLLSNFSNPEVGLVAGMLCDNEKSPSFFRKCIHLLSSIENKEGTCFSVHGALYAIRKDCLTKVPSDIIFDDLFMNVYVVSKGMKVISEPRAVFYDLNFQSYYKKERIERLTRGLLLFFFNHLHTILKMKPEATITFICHKYGKIINAVLVILFLITALLEKKISTVLLIYTIPALLLLYIANKTVKTVFDFIIFQNTSLVKYFLNINRSVVWEKLFIYKTISKGFKDSGH